MGFGGSADTFQAQMMDLMASLEYMQGYIDGLLSITTGVLDDHLSKIMTVLTKLHDTRLKVNIANSSFCTHEIKYLSYTLTKEGIKPQPKKVQAILALNPSNTVRDVTQNIMIYGSLTATYVMPMEITFMDEEDNSKNMVP
jgi:hypothetical protein